MANWNKAASIAHLQSKANEKSKGLCARYIRQAVEAGGLTLIKHGSAKDYGQSLQAAGFVAVGMSTPKGDLEGDIAVISPIDGHPHGHITMYDGSRWISDFKQRTMYPGESYRKIKPKYTIYRFNSQVSTFDVAVTLFKKYCKDLW